MQDGRPGMMGIMEEMDGMMGMMQRMHGNMMGMMGDGMMGAMGPMNGGMMQMFDADGNGTVTPEELRTQLQAKLTEFDGDGDGTLSIAEFETLHSAMIREMMVDRFQDLDADGDGAMTADEMVAPANMMERMQMMRSNMAQWQVQPGQWPGHGQRRHDERRLRGSAPCSDWRRSDGLGPQASGRQHQTASGICQVQAMTSPTEISKGRKSKWPIPMIAF